MTHRLRSLLPALVAAALVPLTGCGTIINGSTQTVNVASTPTGAQIRVDGVQNAQTPAMLALDRKNSHTLDISLDGYAPFQIQLTRSTSGWVWGNIVFGGLIGLVVDASTGGMYKLSPAQVSAQLTPGQAAEVGVDEDALYLFVTLEAEPEWQKVGQLEREQ